MLKKLTENTMLTFVLKCLLVAYLLTALLLLLMALLLYRFSLSESMVSIGIIAIYLLTTFLAGFMMGKKNKTRKYLWGLMIGAIYFIILFLVSLISGGNVSHMSVNSFTVLLLCCGGGMLGGMLS